MSGIAKVSEKMKKKLSFGDYTLAAGAALAPVETIQPTPTPEAPEPPVARKIYSISREDADKLQEIFSNRLKTNTGSSISEIMSDAIAVLYQREM